VEGTVVVECVIDTGGRITNLRILKPVPLLDQAVIDAVRQCRYTPSVYNGPPVSVL
jgi:protein TonB